jgi:hypothetical protein
MRAVLVVVVLVGIASLGVAHVVNPGWFVKRSGVRKGGKLLDDWNEMGFRIVGAILAAGSLYILYSIFR